MEEVADFETTVNWIYDLAKRERSGMRLGLGSVSGLCGRVGDPQDSFRSVHVAGTNGKGSVAHMVEAVLRRHGIRTGLYTSPHLQTFCERVKVDGRSIAEDDVVAIARRLLPHVEAMGFAPTFFDVTTTLAFVHFRDMEVERGVVEVGLGGRLDSTNVLRKVDVCVLTNIGLEHTDVLGKDIASIAREKASIFKEGSVAVVGDMPEEAMGVVEGLARDREVKALRRGAVSEVLDQRVEGMTVRVEGTATEYRLRLPLMGVHQARNAALAITALEAMDPPPSRSDVEGGLASVSIPGRLERVGASPLVLVDGAHNPPAAREVASAIRDLFDDRRAVLVVGMMMDKDVDGFLASIAPVASALVATRAASERAVPAEDIARKAGRHCRKVRTAGTVEEAMAAAVDLAGRDGVVLATGSFYVAGEARQLFRPVTRYL